MRCNLLWLGLTVGGGLRGCGRLHAGSSGGPKAPSSPPKDQAEPVAHKHDHNAPGKHGGQQQLRATTSTMPNSPTTMLPEKWRSTLRTAISTPSRYPKRVCFSPPSSMDSPKSSRCRARPIHREASRDSYSSTSSFAMRSARGRMACVSTPRSKGNLTQRRTPLRATPTKSTAKSMPTSTMSIPARSTRMNTARTSMTTKRKGDRK